MTALAAGLTESESMRLRPRLTRLERLAAVTGRDRACPLCASGPRFTTVRVTADDALSGKALLDDPAPCSQCGEAPTVIAQIAVETREQARALAALEGRMWT